MSGWLEWVPLAQDVALLVCLVVTGAIAVVGLVYLNDRSEP
ncbi:hypothetical protein [Agrococcus jejuensis]|nr:hypothetical protein [Agrococcus jejuensis]